MIMKYVDSNIKRYETEEKFLKRVKLIFIENGDSAKFREPTTYEEAVEYLNETKNNEFIKPRFF